MTRAITTGRLRSLLWAGVLVGLAFQAKMLQAWLVLPALYLAYLVAAPARSLPPARASTSRCPASSTLVVSLSWMTAVTLVPSADRPYVDGSCDDSVFTPGVQLQRLGPARRPASSGRTACSPRSRLDRHVWRATRPEQQINTAGIGPAWDRLLHGPFGHDGAWLLLPALVSPSRSWSVRRRGPRTDPPRAAAVLWLTWLVLLFGFFSAGRLINSYYVAALVPAVAALCAMGARPPGTATARGPARAVLAAPSSPPWP